MKSKKGFTLIELLAVILILGIIALIAIPTVTNIVTESKKNSLKETTQTLASSISDQCNQEILADETITSSYYISGGTSTPTIDVHGKLPSDGVANVSDSCNVEIFVTSDKYCAAKSYDDDKVELGTVDSDNCILSSGTTMVAPTATTPSSCYIYTEAGAITGYHFEDSGCPSEINIPDQINGTVITSIADAAFVGDYDTMIYGNNYTGIMDTANNFDFYAANFEATYGFELVIDYAFPVSDVGAVQKECYDTYTDEPTVKPINYELTGSDGFSYCDMYYSDVQSKTNFYTNLTTVNLGNAKHLTSIGIAAFFGNEIKTVIFGQIPLVTIGASAFDRNVIEGIMYLDKLTQLKTVSGCAFNSNYIEQLLLPSNLERIGYSAFYYNSLTNINFNNGTTYIGVSAFADNILTSLKLGSTVQTIGVEAFNTAGTITDLIIPNSVTLIDIGAFAHSGVVNLSLGTGVKNIYDWAFYDNKITSLIIPNSLTSLGHNTFNTNNIASLTIGTGLTSLAARTFMSNLLTTVNIPSNISAIAADAFSTNANLKTINIYKASGSITNSPWGTTGATINWLG